MQIVKGSRAQQTTRAAPPLVPAHEPVQWYHAYTRERREKLQNIAQIATWAYEGLNKLNYAMIFPKKWHEGKIGQIICLTKIIKDPFMLHIRH